MKYWERFINFKERGEWVELQFMARAAQHRFTVIKPWGDTRAYDVGIEHEENFLRVQVKSTTSRSGAGYRCMFMPNHQKRQDYSLDQIDLFAAYVIPEDAWYLIRRCCCWASEENAWPCYVPSSRRRKRPAIATKATAKIGTCSPEAGGNCWTARVIGAAF